MNGAAHDRLVALEADETLLPTQRLLLACFTSVAGFLEDSGCPFTPEQQQAIECASADVMEGVR
jgi:hypothetical protein